MSSCKITVLEKIQVSEGYVCVQINGYDHRMQKRNFSINTHHKNRIKIMPDALTNAF